jgi:hypothetical protein
LVLNKKNNHTAVFILKEISTETKQIISASSFSYFSFKNIYERIVYRRVILQKIIIFF